jgi:hypothetical protein
MSKRNKVSPVADLGADLLALAEDRGQFRNPHGLICAANESRFVSGHYSEQLTGLTVGWKDMENLEALLDRLFPMVMVSRRFDFKKANNAEAFLSEVDDIRAIGQKQFKSVQYTGTEATSKTLNKGLTISIDHDQTDDLEAEVASSISRLQARLVRNDLRRGFTLLDTLDTAGGNKEFDVDTNPDGHIRAMLVASADVTGLYPNVVTIGEGAWHKRLDAYEGATRENGAGHAAWTPAQLAAYLMADVVEVVKARYQSSLTAKGNVTGATNRIYAYLASQGISKDDPSAVKRFVSSSRGGGRWGVYRVEHEKCTDVSVEHYSNIVGTGIGVASIDAITT